MKFVPGVRRPTGTLATELKAKFSRSPSNLVLVVSRVVNFNGFRSVVALTGRQRPERTIVLGITIDDTGDHRVIRHKGFSHELRPVPRRIPQYNGGGGRRDAISSDR